MRGLVLLLGLMIHIANATAFSYQCGRTEPVSILFITGGRDFDSTFSTLQERGHDVYVISPEGSTHHGLHRTAPGLLFWEDLLNPEATSLDIRPNLNACSTLQRSELSQATAARSIFLKVRVSTPTGLHKSNIYETIQACILRNLRIPAHSAATKPAIVPANAITLRHMSSSRVNFQGMADGAKTRDNSLNTPSRRQTKSSKLIGLLRDLRDKGEKRIKHRRLQEVVRGGSEMTKKEADDHIKLAQDNGIVRVSKVHDVLELHPDFY